MAQVPVQVLARMGPEISSKTSKASKLSKLSQASKAS